MKKTKNEVYDLCDYQNAAFVWEQWGVINDHEQRIRKLETQLIELKKKIEEKKQVHHLGRVHEF